jgi:hypothetical protein
MHYEDSSESDSSISESDTGSEDSESSDGSDKVSYKEQQRLKQDLLIKIQMLEKKGFEFSKKFNMTSKYDEMLFEYEKVKKFIETQASIKFSRRCLMACVTGLEFLNKKFDPFKIKLDGWSEQVHENVNDYDDIFEELHDKYKGSGRKMAPELRLLMSLSGSAFMFHLTNSMFKQSKVPDVEDVIRSNPDLMKQFQQAALNKMGANAAASMPSAANQSRGGGNNGGGGGMFSMIGNMFSMASPTFTHPPPPQSTRAGQPRYNPPNESRVNVDVEDIIEDIHAEITSRPSSVTNANRMETMSVSDEEITSIMEDSSDAKLGMAAGRRNRVTRPKKASGPAASARTFNL